MNVNLTALLVRQRSLGFQHILFERCFKLFDRKTSVEPSQVESALRITDLLDIEIGYVDSIVLDENVHAP